MIDVPVLKLELPISTCAGSRFFSTGTRAYSAFRSSTSPLMANAM
ncbi:MAG: hAT transposon family protein [Parafilimonas terrae]|nr:hAT transposon family protein [Parafilimonas terrae]